MDWSVSPARVHPRSPKTVRLLLCDRLHASGDLQEATEDSWIDPMRTIRRGSPHAHVVERVGEFCQTTNCCSFDAGKRSNPDDCSWPPLVFPDWQLSPRAQGRSRFRSRHPTPDDRNTCGCGRSCSGPDSRRLLAHATRYGPGIFRKVVADRRRSRLSCPGLILMRPSRWLGIDDAQRPPAGGTVTRSR